MEDGSTLLEEGMKTAGDEGVIRLEEAGLDDGVTTLEETGLDEGAKKIGDDEGTLEGTLDEGAALV